MVEESSPLLPPAEESIKAETDTALEPEPESGELTPELTSETDFVCDCKESTRSACKGLPFYREHEGQRYCVLHYPGKEKSADFKAALDSKLNNKDFDFRGVWFPDKADFHGLQFEGPADFNSATFEAEAVFGSATFRADADFNYAIFSAAATFPRTTFRAATTFRLASFGADASFASAAFSTQADFSYATFRANVDLSYVTFDSAADFSFTIFSADATFIHCRISDSLTFHGNERDTYSLDGSKVEIEAGRLGGHTTLDFQYSRIEKPSKVSFHTAALRPHWFVNADSSDFVFTDASWDCKTIKPEIEALEKKAVSSPRKMLIIACRQLAENAEENNRYEEASRFRYWAMDLARRTKWKGWAFWKTDWLHMLYWAVSGYGERILRALGVLVAVWFVFVLFYTQVGFEQKPPPASNESASPMTAASATIEDITGRPLEFSRGLTYSLAVMSLQKPEPRPLTNWAHTLVTLETILGPVQAALLALAIRRKFMR